MGKGALFTFIYWSYIGKSCWTFLLVWLICLLSLLDFKCKLSPANNYNIPSFISVAIFFSIGQNHHYYSGKHNLHKAHILFPTLEEAPEVYPLNTTSAVNFLYTGWVLLDHKVPTSNF